MLTASRCQLGEMKNVTVKYRSYRDEEADPYDELSGGRGEAQTGGQGEARSAHYHYHSQCWKQEKEKVRRRGKSVKSDEER